MRGKLSESRTPRMTSAVSRLGSVMMPSVATPSRAICSRMKRPICSSPTRVMHRGLEAEARRADRDVGGAAADRLGEGAHVLQPAADLLAVEVDRGAPDGDDVKVLGHLAFLPSAAGSVHSPPVLSAPEWAHHSTRCLTLALVIMKQTFYFLSITE